MRIQYIPGAGMSTISSMRQGHLGFGAQDVHRCATLA
jgi:hypothetical protein